MKSSSKGSYSFKPDSPQKSSVRDKSYERDKSSSPSRSFRLSTLLRRESSKRAEPPTANSMRKLSNNNNSIQSSNYNYSNGNNTAERSRTSDTDTLKSGNLVVRENKSDLNYSSQNFEVGGTLTNGSGRLDSPDRYITNIVNNINISNNTAENRLSDLNKPAEFYVNTNLDKLESNTTNTAVGTSPSFKSTSSSSSSSTLKSDTVRIESSPGNESLRNIMKSSPGNADSLRSTLKSNTQPEIRVTNQSTVQQDLNTRPEEVKISSSSNMPGSTANGSTLSFTAMNGHTNGLESAASNEDQYEATDFTSSTQKTITPISRPKDLPIKEDASLSQIKHIDKELQSTLSNRPIIKNSNLTVETFDSKNNHINGSNTSSPSGRPGKDITTPSSQFALSLPDHLAPQPASSPVSPRHKLIVRPASTSAQLAAQLLSPEDPDSPLSPLDHSGARGTIDRSHPFFSRVRYEDPDDTIYSSNGTLRGTQNRVKSGISVFTDRPKHKNWSILERDRIVVYTTSVQVIHHTHSRCLKIKKILQTHRIRFEERDVFVNKDYSRELSERLGQVDPELPQLFADGVYIGDSAEVDRLNETGTLREIFKEFKKVDTRITCPKCGGYRFVPCSTCHGSRKTTRNAFTKEFSSLKCTACDRNGLVKCDMCDIIDNCDTLNNGDNKEDNRSNADNRASFDNRSNGDNRASFDNRSNGFPDNHLEYDNTVTRSNTSSKRVSNVVSISSDIGSPISASSGIGSYMGSGVASAISSSNSSLSSSSNIGSNPYDMNGGDEYKYTSNNSYPELKQDNITDTKL